MVAGCGCWMLQMLRMLEVADVVGCGYGLQVVDVVDCMLKVADVGGCGPLARDQPDAIADGVVPRY